MPASPELLRGNREQDLKPLLTIQQVSQLLDVPSSTLRSWERRYGLLSTSRSPGGHRRYALTELQVLSLMRDHVNRGVRAATAATLVAAAVQTPVASLVEAITVGADRLEPAVIEERLDAAERLLGLDRTIDEVLLPALRHLGHRWRTGHSGIAAEHLATATVRAWLARRPRSEPRAPRAGPLVLSCGPRDEHTVGLEGLVAILGRRGYDCRMLGARTPVQSLVAAVQETAPAGVVLVSHLSAARPAAIRALEAVAPLQPCGLFYAGHAFAARRSRQGLPGTYLGESLSEAADLIATELTPAVPGPPDPLLSGPGAEGAASGAGCAPPDPAAATGLTATAVGGAVRSSCGTTSGPATGGW